MIWEIDLNNEMDSLHAWDQGKRRVSQRHMISCNEYMDSSRPLSQHKLTAGTRYIAFRDLLHICSALNNYYFNIIITHAYHIIDSYIRCIVRAVTVADLIWHV
jgi:hypothetical protein